MQNTITLPVAGASSYDSNKSPAALVSINGTSTVRRFNTVTGKPEMVIAHTNTKENGTHATRRSTFRLNFPSADADGKPVNGFVQVVIGQPLQFSGFNPEAALAYLLGCLAVTIEHGGDIVEDSSSSPSVTVSAFGLSLLGGEI